MAGNSSWMQVVMQARFLVAALGEAASPAWWRSDATNATSLRMLERLYPRTFVAASLEFGLRRSPPFTRVRESAKIQGFSSLAFATILRCSLQLASQLASTGAVITLALSERYRRMISDEMYAALQTTYAVLQSENASLFEKLVTALQCINELEAKKTTLSSFVKGNAPALSKH